MPSFRVHTFGCQMNERDSEIVSGLLRRMGLTPAARDEDAAVVVVNTCTVREHAEQRALSLLGRLRPWREERPERVLVLAGCVPGVRGREIRRRFPHVDVVVSPSNLLGLPDLVGRVWDRNLPQVAVEEAAGIAELPDEHPPGFRAWVKIMEGCDHACSFCAVPRARGPERHRPFAEIVSEVEGLAGRGVREVTLLGQTVNAYGKRAGPGRDFAALLRRLSEIEGLERLRFTSPHPVYHTAAVLRAMGESRAVCEHMHLPVQSGSDRILRAMRRGHAAEHFLELVERARGLIRGLAVTTDLIVGFPGEDDGDFAATLDLVRRAGLSGAYAFKYSPRPGTPAAEMSGQVPEELKEERLARLNFLLDDLSRRQNEKLVGSAVEVMVEGPREEEGLWQGRMRSNRLVEFPAEDGVAPGQIRTAEITAAGTWSLSGKLAAGVRS